MFHGCRHAGRGAGLLWRHQAVVGGSEEHRSGGAVWLAVGGLGHGHAAVWTWNHWLIDWSIVLPVCLTSLEQMLDLITRNSSRRKLFFILGRRNFFSIGKFVEGISGNPVPLDRYIVIFCMYWITARAKRFYMYRSIDHAWVVKTKECWYDSMQFMYVCSNT